MLLEYLVGKQFHLDYAGGGTGTVDPAILMEQDSLVDQKQEFIIIDVAEVDNGKKVDIRITNTGLEVGYQMQQIGIWAHIGNDAPALFAVLQDDGGIAIASKHDIPEFSLDFFAVILISNTGKFNLTIDPATLVSYVMMDKAITTLMHDIALPGLLIGDGNGNISKAVPGVDYGFPLLNGNGDPTEDTVGCIGQHYLNNDTGREFLCIDENEGVYTWVSTNANKANQIKYYNSEIPDATTVQDALDFIQERLSNASGVVFSETRPAGEWMLWFQDLGEIPGYPDDGQITVMMDTAPLDTEDEFVMTYDGGGSETILNMTDNPETAGDDDIIIVEDKA